MHNGSTRRRGEKKKDYIYIYTFFFFREIMVKVFPNVMENIHQYIQVAQQTPGEIFAETNMQTHQRENVERQRENIESIKRNHLVIYKRNKNINR